MSSTHADETIQAIQHPKIMDLPITPKFFKKVELFQELDRLNHRNRGHEEWEMEKKLLSWAHKNHFHLGSYIGRSRVIEILSETFSQPSISAHSSKTMENLVEHDWADGREQREYEIKFNSNGLLMAEVVSGEGRFGQQVFYKLVIALAWALILIGALSILISGLRAIIDYFLNIEWKSALLPNSRTGHDPVPPGLEDGKDEAEACVDWRCRVVPGMTM